MTLLLLACRDYSVDFELAEPFAPGRPEHVGALAADPSIPPVEECNGADDDGDGAVDEDFRDGDGNGRADCLDASCPEPDAGGSGAVGMLEACDGVPTRPPTPVDDPWRLSVQWTFNAGGDPYYETVVAPVIGNLDDDDGDGVVGADDIPEVVFTTTSNHLVVLDGATGALKWEPGSRSAGLMNPALGDVDGDGAPDIVAFDTAGTPVAFEADGTLKWRAAEPGAASMFSAASIVDLEGDGDLEVIADDRVLDGATGALRFRLPSSSDALVRSVAVADIDLDGDQEIFYDGVAFDSDGGTLWGAEAAHSVSVWPLVVQADGDDEGEVVFVTNELAVYDDDGTLLTSVDLGEIMGSGPPCAGDFDGDGEMEIALAPYTVGPLLLFELDGRVAWTAPTPKDAVGGGCSGFDVDGDGALEVLFPGDEGFLVIDGRTGTTLATWTPHTSYTAIHYASVADIDHDGHAEIVVASSGEAPSVFVTALEHDGEGWPAAGPIWSNHDFTMTNVGPDGTVPQNPEPSWLRNKVYRARTAVDGTPSAADLYVRILDVCVADCDYGPVRIDVQVANRGLLDAEAGAELAIYAADGDGERLVALTTLPAVPAGVQLATQSVDLGAADVGTAGFVARVNEGAGVYECDTSNNDDDWRDVFCP